MYEKTFLQILKDLRDSNQSMSRVVSHPEFKAFPLVERVELLKKYAPLIREHSRYDRKFWEDVTAGAVGIAMTAPVLGGFVSHAVASSRHGYEQGVAAGSGEPFDKPAPVLSLTPTGSILFGAGSGIAASSLRKATSARRDLINIKSFLRPEAGATTDEDAVKVISRS